jgi:hypothetical protein
MIKLARQSKALLIGVTAIAVFISGPAATADSTPADEPTENEAREGRPIFYPDEDAPTETEFDVTDPEVTSYASHFGISAERSLEIANWMDKNVPLLEDLQELDDNYADARLIHGGRAGGSVTTSRFQQETSA